MEEQNTDTRNGNMAKHNDTMLYKSAVKLLKAIKELQSQDLSYHLTADPDHAGVLIKNLQERLLSVANRVLSKQGLPDTLLFTNASQVIDRFLPVVDLLDNSYEKVDTRLSLVEENEKASGSKKLPVTPDVVHARIVAKKEGDETFGIVVARNLARPQNQFADKVDNGYTTPFVSLVYQLGQKPNAIKPISKEHLAQFQGVKLADITLEMAAKLPYPYQFEQDQIVYPEALFQYADPIPSRSLDDTPLRMVTDIKGLEEMLLELKEVDEIAVDLEHHDYRSYQGFVSLMQISSRSTDYIVDTLLLRRELFILNEVFTDPKITKVFHGAESDIIWLQRDFGLYVVNLFDTYHASCYLELEKHSLAHLLHLYVGVEADKSYQLADWRIRPLPQSMVEYARSDTHYLLEIFDKLRNELVLASNPETLSLVNSVLNSSQMTASRRFVRTAYDSETGLGSNGWAATLEKCRLPLSPRQVAAFRQLHAWRDARARDEDESVRFILPNQMLFSLAFKMPTNSAGVLGCCEPVPIAVRMSATEIASLIADIDLEISGGSSSSKRIVAPSNLFLAETSLSTDEELINHINLPVASSLLGKSFQELNFPTPSAKNAASVSVLFGAGFFDMSDSSLIQANPLKIALLDQISTTMDFCPLPSTVVIEAQLDDSRIAKNDQLVSLTAAPEGHDFVRVKKAKRPFSKDEVMVPSRSFPQNAEDIISSARHKASDPIESISRSAPILVEEHDYSNSASLVASMTSMPSKKHKHKANDQKKAPDSNQTRSDVPFDPFGADLEKGAGAIKGARDHKNSRSGHASSSSHRSQTFKR